RFFRAWGLLEVLVFCTVLSCNAPITLFSPVLGPRLPPPPPRAAGERLLMWRIGFFKQSARPPMTAGPPPTCRPITLKARATPPPMSPARPAALPAPPPRVIFPSQRNRPS